MAAVVATEAVEVVVPEGAEAAELASAVVAAEPVSVAAGELE
jgi:hypothetical protein